MIREEELGHSLREISSGFFVLCLLFSEKPSEGNNIVINLFLGHRGCNSARHGEKGAVIKVPYERRYDSDGGY